MAISVISISLDSSEESVGAFTARVILFGTIPTTIPSIVPTVDSPTIPHIAPTIYTLITTIITYSRFTTYSLDFTCTTWITLPTSCSYLTRASDSCWSTLPHSANYSSSDHFTSDDSLRESSSDSSSESSSEFYSDTSPDSSLRHSSLASSIPRALSYVRFDLLPPRKRIKDYDFVTDFDVSSKEGYVPYIGLAIDVGDSYEPYTKPDIDPDVKEDIDACIAFTDDIATRGTKDYPDLVCAIGSLEVMQKGLDTVMQELYDHMVEIQSAAMSEMISTLERDNMRLKGMLGTTKTEMKNEQQDDNVKANVNNGKGNGNGNGNPNVNNEGVVPVTREFTYQDFLKCQPLNFKGTEGVVGLTRNVIAAELTRLHDAILIANNLMDQKFKGYAVKNAENKAYTVGNNVERKAYVGTLHYYNKCSMHHEGPCTVKCGNCKRVGHMTRDFKAVVAATALRNKKRNNEAKARSYAIGGGGASPDSNVVTGTNGAIKFETKKRKYSSCARHMGEITRKITVVAYNGARETKRRFQELALLYTKMVPNEEDRVEKHIGGLPANIQGNVIAAELTRLHDAIRIANNLMDQKFKGYAENKRRKACVGTLHDYNKYSMHHEGPCTVKCGNWKSVGHMTRDCKVAVVATTLKSPIGNLTGVTCYECGRQGHYRSECPKLRKQNRGNKKGTNEAKARSYAIGGGGSSPDSNVVTGTFLLNNRYASMLFDSGIDRSFVLTIIGFLAQLMYKKQCKQFAHYVGLFLLTGCARLSILMYPVTEAVVL
nr:hypothetical protein [Tanacetum cinerariifolium]